MTRSYKTAIRKLKRRLRASKDAIVIYDVVFYKRKTSVVVASSLPYPGFLAFFSMGERVGLDTLLVKVAAHAYCRAIHEKVTEILELDKASRITLEGLPCLSTNLNPTPSQEIFPTVS